MANNKIWSAIIHNSTETAFNLWGKSFSDALSDVGMINSYRSRAWNTEEGNWTTGVNIDKVVEVWTFATNPSLPALFIRLGYGKGNVYTYPRITVRVGTAHDGNGNVTGLSNLTHNDVLASAYFGTNSVTNWISCDNNGLAIVVNPTVTNSNSGNNFLIIDRYRSSNGSPLSTGAVLFSGNPNNGLKQINYDLIENDGVNFGSSAYSPCIVRSGMNVSTPYLNAYGQTQIYPWWSSVRSGHGVSKMICTYANNDRPVGTEQSVAWLTTSTNRSIRTCGVMANYTPYLDYVGSSGSAFAIWWND